MQFKFELTSKYYALSCRLRLFDTVDTPTVLYGMGVMALTKAHGDFLQRSQRRMLRMVLGSRRRPTSCETVAVVVDVDSDAEKEDPENCLAEDARDNTLTEPWVDRIRRTTHDVEERCKQLDASEG